MKEKLTVSDSKKLFHEQFTFVIPGLYKKIVDELLVELNLLNHQNEFIQDNLFCFGLTETFNVLTKGYKPEEHLPLLFESLCKSSNFDSETIKKVSKKVLEDYSKKTLKEISELLKEKCNTNLYPSRLLNLGIYSIISNATDYDKINDSEKQEFITNVFNDLNLSVNKAEKDIGLYKSSLTKLQQAKELLQETKLKRQKK